MGGWELDYLRTDARDEAGIRKLLDYWPSQPDDPPLDIPTADNTSEVDALKKCIGKYELGDDAEFQNGHEFEYFAVLALWLAAEAIDGLNWTSDPNVLAEKLHAVFAPVSLTLFPELATKINEVLQDARDGIPETLELVQAAMQSCAGMGITDTSIAFSMSGSKALHAMDAVGYAEQLNATRAQAEELAELRFKLYLVTQNADALAEEKATKKISLAASKAAIRRHSENHAMKKDVFAWCAAHMHEYSSMDAAAEAVAGKVVPVVFRTARSWVGEYQKKERSARKL